MNDGNRAWIVSWLTVCTFFLHMESIPLNKHSFHTELTPVKCIPFLMGAQRDSLPLSCAPLILGTCPYGALITPTVLSGLPHVLGHTLLEAGACPVDPESPEPRRVPLRCLELSRYQLLMGRCTGCLLPKLFLPLWLMTWLRVRNMKQLAWVLAGMAVTVIPEHFGAVNSMEMDVDRQVFMAPDSATHLSTHSFTHSFTHQAKVGLGQTMRESQRVR